MIVVYEDRQDYLLEQQGGGGVQPSLQDRIYDVEGCSTAITTSFMPSIAQPFIVAIRGREPQVLTPKRTEFGKAIRKKYEAHEIEISRHYMQKLEPRTDGVTNTLTSVQKDNYLAIPEATSKGYAEAHEEMRYRIRKLTPRECFRLMGVDDADIDKIQGAGISNSQQYKMAGNSIVVDTLYHLFRKMFIATGCEREGHQQTLF